jgi:hypothetical protein
VLKILLRRTLHALGRPARMSIVVFAFAASLIAPASIALTPELLDIGYKVLQPRSVQTPNNTLIAPRTFRDPSEIALDSVAVIAAIGLILYLAPKAVRQPMHVTVQPQAGPHESVPDVSDYLRVTTEKLASLGFSQELDFRVPELPHEGFFRYMSLRDGSHTALLCEVTPGAKGNRPNIGFKKVQFLEFQTILAGDTKINTNNNPLKNYLAPPPNRYAKKAPYATEPRELFDYHRMHVEEVRTQKQGDIVSQRLEEFINRFPSEWKRVNEYQVSAGLLRRDSKNNQYLGTSKVIIRALLSGFTEEFGGLSGLIIPLMVAIFMGLIVWGMPIMSSLTGLQRMPVLPAELEICAIGILGLAVGLAARTGGGIYGPACATLRRHFFLKPVPWDFLPTL